MAEKTAHDVVNQVQSVRDPSPTDVSATQPIATPALVASKHPLQSSQTPSTAPDNATVTTSDQNESSVVGDTQAESGEIDLGAVGLQGNNAKRTWTDLAGQCQERKLDCGISRGSSA